MAGVLGSGVAVDWGMRNIWMGAEADARITAEDYAASYDSGGVA